MPKLKKVNYTTEGIRYWICPYCKYINETDMDSGVEVFPQCEYCEEKFRWGVDEDTLGECKKGYGGHDFCVVNSNTGIINCCNCGKEKTKCKDCKGKGYVVARNTGKFKHQTTLVDCHVCGGSSYLPQICQEPYACDACPVEPCKNICPTCKGIGKIKIDQAKMDYIEKGASIDTIGVGIIIVTVLIALVLFYCTIKFAGG